MKIIEMVVQLEPLHESEIYLYYCDHRGLPLALIDVKGRIEWNVEFDEWGNVLREDNPENMQQLIRLPGQQWDKKTGLYYNRHRYLDPEQGRYITQDPIGLRGGWNLYSYPLNPIVGIDPLGLATCMYSIMIGMLSCVSDTNAPPSSGSSNYIEGTTDVGLVANGAVTVLSELNKKEDPVHISTTLSGGVGGGGFSGIITCQQYTKCIVN